MSNNHILNCPKKRKVSQANAKKEPPSYLGGSERTMFLYLRDCGQGTSKNPKQVLLS
jgi:hypothetical protein